MIQEAYCSEETYRLLREKGFDNSVGEIQTIFDDEGVTKPAISLYVAMRWLREVHGIGIFPSTYLSMKGEELSYHYGTAIVSLNTHELMTYNIMKRDSYEEACEAALIYTLENLI